MKLLEERILKDGDVLGKDILKVNDEYEEVSREEFIKLYKEELKKFK